MNFRAKIKIKAIREMASLSMRFLCVRALRVTAKKIKQLHGRAPDGRYTVQRASWELEGEVPGPWRREERPYEGLPGSRDLSQAPKHPLYPDYK